MWNETRDASVKRNYPPGQHGRSGRSHAPSHYAKCRKEFSKMKAFIHVRAKALGKMISASKQSKQNSVEAFVAAVESRVDMIVYRAGFAPTIFAARALVSSRAITINGQRIQSASQKVGIGDVISTIPKAAQRVIGSIDAMGGRECEYVEVDRNAPSAKLLRMPTPEEVVCPPINVDLLARFVS